jgi:hypothetical protein
MSERTAFLGKLLGLYCIVIALSMFAHKQAFVETVTALFQNAPLMFVVGLMSVAAGLAMVLGHNVWSGGALPVIVTIIGWATLIKGLLIWFLSPATESGIFLGGLHYERFFSVYAAFSLLLGGYLTYAGFKSKAR